MERPAIEVPITGRPTIEWARELKADARLWLVRAGEGEDGRRRQVDLAGRAVTVVGRQPAGSDIVIDGAAVSRRHAAIAFDEDGACWVVDLGSQSKTTTKDGPLKPLVPRKIAPGDKIIFGEDGPWMVVAAIDKDEGTPVAKKQKREETTVVLERVRCSHILVKHQGSRNPRSFRKPE
jgi:hypothetical protein